MNSMLKVLLLVKGYMLFCVRFVLMSLTDSRAHKQTIILGALYYPGRKDLAKEILLFCLKQRVS
jgi:hypothetical protein